MAASMTDTFRPLPILTATGELPAGADLTALKFAKLSSGYEGLVVPRKAHQGSPGPILAVGAYPDWLCEFVYVNNWSNLDTLTDALRTVLINPERALGPTFLLSRWMQGPVKFIGEEAYSE